MNAEEYEKREMEGEETLKDALRNFEKQYDANLVLTGYSYTDKDDDGIILNEEYFVYNLVTSKIEDELDVEIGGWFSYDDRGNEICINCLLAVKVIGGGNDMLIGDESEALQGEYDLQREKWRLYWEPY